MWQEARGLVGGVCGGVEGMSDEVHEHQKNEPEQRKGAAMDTSGLFGPSIDCVEAVHELYSYLERRADRVSTRRSAHPSGARRPCGGAPGVQAQLRKVIANRCKDRVPQTLIERVAEAIDQEAGSTTPTLTSPLRLPPAPPVRRPSRRR